MTEYNENDYLALSGIQHFMFCRRQWALIHIEQQWQENLRTTEGHLLHENVHDPFFNEKRKNTVISRGVPVSSRKMGVYGVCDAVFFYEDDNGITLPGRNGRYSALPCEYKRGKPKEDDADILQVAAQSMCLEEMLCCIIPEADLYYGETKHKIKVEITPELRKKVTDIFEEMHMLYDKRYTPKVKTTTKCRSCSLYNLCMPKLCKNISVSKYIEEMTKSEGEL